MSGEYGSTNRIGHEIWGIATSKGLSLLQRLADQSEFEILQIAQPAMEQLGRGRRCGLRQIALFGQSDGQTAARRIAGNGAAIDATTDNEQVCRVGPVCRRHVNLRFGPK